METINYYSKTSEKARRAVVLKALFEYMTALSVSGAFLAKLLATLEVSDSMNGIISSVASVAFMSQIFSFFLANKKINVKVLVTASQTLSMGLFSFLYVIPFIPIPQQSKSVIFVIIICLAQITKSMFSPLYFNWWATYVPSHQRASFYARISKASHIFGSIVYVTALAVIVDMFESTNNINGAFLFVVIISTLFNLLHFLCIMNIKNCKISSETKEKIPFSGVIKNLFSNKAYVAILIMYAIQGFAGSFTAGFISVYSIKELGMNMVTIQIFTLISVIFAILTAKPFGKLADKKGYITSICHGYMLSIIAYTAIAFTTPSVWFIIIVYNILQNISASAVGNNPSNMLYKYVHSDYISQALTIKNIFCGIISFVSAVLGGMLLDFIQQSGNTFMGFNIYGQQVLAVVTVFAMIIAYCIGKFVVAKQKEIYD